MSITLCFSAFSQRGTLFASMEDNATEVVLLLTLKALSKFAADDTYIFLLLSFEENKA